MKYLQILNATLTALGAALGLCLLVVTLFYAIYLDRHPDLPRQLPLVLAATAGFAGLFVAAGATFLGHRRGWGVRWLLQVTPLAPIAALAMLFASLRA